MQSIDLTFALNAGKLPGTKVQRDQRNMEALSRNLREIRKNSALFTKFGWREVFEKHMHVRDVVSVFGPQAATFVRLYREGLIRRVK